MTKILVLYYSLHGNTRQLARHICRGIEQVDGCEAILRTVADIHTIPTTSVISTRIETSTDPIVTHDDLKQCSAMAMGSPVRFGNMAAPLKHFLDSTSGEWLSGTLIDLLHTTHHGGTPYGASHVNNGTNKQLHPDEIALAQAIGRRLATIACKLSG
jgi:NAD(P)H dehydrogenase (quinone)